MKRWLILATVIASALTLTACDSKEKESYSSTEKTTESNKQIIETIDPDSDEGKDFDASLDQSYLNSHKDFLDYTLDGKYDVSLPYQNIFKSGTEYEQLTTTWDVKFKAKNGIELKEKLINSEFIEIEKQFYGTKDVQDLAEFDSLISSAMGHIARDDFAEKIASKYLDIEYDAISDTYITPEGELTVLAYPPVYIGGLEMDQLDKSIELVQERMTVGSGWKISETDLASVGQSKDFVFSCKFVLDEGVDADGYAEKIENIMKDYQELVGTPQNYSFYLAQRGNEKWLYRKLNIMGEEISDELIDSDSYNFSDEMKKAIIESHE